MGLTKTKIIEEISQRLKISQPEAKYYLETFLETMKSTLESGEDVMISGFGKFQVQDKAPRKGRNPATGKNMILKERRIVTFGCSGKLREKINGVDEVE